MRFLKVNIEVIEDVAASVDVTDLSEDISLKKAEVGSCNSWPLHGDYSVDHLLSDQLFLHVEDPQSYQ